MAKFPGVYIKEACSVGCVICGEPRMNNWFSCEWCSDGSNISNELFGAAKADGIYDGNPWREHLKVKERMEMLVRKAKTTFRSPEWGIPPLANALEDYHRVQEA